MSKKGCRIYSDHRQATHKKLAIVTATIIHMSVANFQGQGSQSRAFAHATTQSDPVVFASDHGRAKQYYVTNGGFDAVFDHVFDLPEADRTFYEMIPPSTPCKLYFDLDLAGDESMVGRMDAIQEKLVVRVNHALSAMFDVAADPLVLTSDGIKPDGTTKASRHLVWPVYFVDFTHVKGFVEQHVLPFEGVDKGVYTKNRCMRFYGCHKIGSNRVLRMPPGAPAAAEATLIPLLAARLASIKRGHTLPYGLSMEIIENPLRSLDPERFDTLLNGKPLPEKAEPHGQRQIFMRSLITETPPVGTTLVRVSLMTAVKRAPKRAVTTDESVRASRPPKRAATSSVSTKIQAVADRFRATFDGIPPGAETREIRPRELNGNPQAAWRWDGGHCGVAERVHRSNGTIFRLDLVTMDGYFTCFDDDCDGVWGRSNYALVLDPDAFRYRAKRLPRRWFRPLERFIDDVVAPCHPEAEIRSVEYDVLQQRISIECDVQPNPCTCEGHQHEAFHTTLAVIHIGRRSDTHVGFWECRGYGSDKQRRELCDDVADTLAKCGFQK